MVRGRILKKVLIPVILILLLCSMHVSAKKAKQKQQLTKGPDVQTPPTTVLPFMKSAPKVSIKAASAKVDAALEAQRQRMQIMNKVASVFGFRQDYMMDGKKVQKDGSVFYEIKRARPATMLGFFNVNIDETLTIDEKLSKILSTDEAWWSFLVRYRDDPIPDEDERFPQRTMCDTKGFNSRCFDIGSDKDGDCYMGRAATESVCGFDLREGYNQAVYQAWLNDYPWDCDDSDPLKHKNCLT